MLVPNRANVVKDWAWCLKQNDMGADLEDALPRSDS